MDRFAIVSDLHGNLTAWQAVVDDIRDLGVTATFCLGDLAGKGPRGAEVVDSCRQHCAEVVRGNWDEFLSVEQPADETTFRWHRAQLGTSRCDYLAALPNCLDLVLSGRHVRLFHASAVSAHHRVWPTSDDDELDGMFANTEFTGFDRAAPVLVGYGDIHACYLLPVDGRTLFNVGSVGNPLDATTASYAVLEGTQGGDPSDAWRISFRRVPYDIEKEVAFARQSGMPDFAAYAIELRTGVYRGDHAAAGLTLVD
jgi:predicted phosphodiesterase